MKPFMKELKLFPYCNGKNVPEFFFSFFSQLAMVYLQQQQKCSEHFQLKHFLCLFWGEI